MEKEKKQHVLIVDDNKENLNVVGNLLQSEQYKISVALNANEGLQIMHTNPTDIVLLDVMMPQMDGFEMCKKIKAEENLKHIPVIFLTAPTDESDIVKGFQVGGVDYITKPFKKEELIMRLKTHLELRQAVQMIEKQAMQLRKANKLILDSINQFGNHLKNEK